MMNRLILVGNGFDLAHGLKTAYKDFIISYLMDCFKSAVVSGEFTDRLIMITGDRSLFINFRNNDELLRSWIYNFLTNYEHRQSVNFINRGNQPVSVFKIQMRSTLLRSLVINIGQERWVDIEGAFFWHLKAILNEDNNSPKTKKLETLNQDLEFLIKKLETYLSNIEKPGYLDGYRDIISSRVNPEDLYRGNLKKPILPSETLILNFNYTDTVAQYLTNLVSTSNYLKPEINFIHGTLNTLYNPIIFGFGDEFDTSYKQMEEDSQVKGYFEYIKSFWYLKTANYRSLVNFIDSDEFQVFILGHSCGLSDRTMLQMIFQHELCKSIRIYYHGNQNENNFTSLTHEIARHFNNKGEMRKKIVSMSRSDRMPQITDP